MLLFTGMKQSYSWIENNPQHGVNTISPSFLIVIRKPKKFGKENLKGIQAFVGSLGNWHNLAEPFAHDFSIIEAKVTTELPQ